MAKALAVQIDLVSLFGGMTTGAEQTATGNNMLASGGLPNPPNPSKRQDWGLSPLGYTGLHRTTPRYMGTRLALHRTTLTKKNCYLAVT